MAEVQHAPSTPAPDDEHEGATPSRGTPTPPGRSAVADAEHEPVVTQRFALPPLPAADADEAQGIERADGTPDAAATQTFTYRPVDVRPAPVVLSDRSDRPQPEIERTVGRTVEAGTTQPAPLAPDTSARAGEAAAAPQAPPPPPPSVAMPPPGVAPAPYAQGGSIAPSAVSYPYGAPAGTIFPPPGPATTRRPSKARVGRRLARRAVRGAGAVGGAIFGVRPLLVIALLLLLPFTAWLAWDKWLVADPPGPTPNAAAQNGLVALPPEPAAIQNYLNGTRRGDVNAVWDSLGIEEKARRLTRGDDKEVLTGVFNFQQRNNLVYSGYHYIGGRALDGTTDLSQGGYYFYTGDVRGSGQTQSVPLLFQVNEQGQITTVTDQLYDFTLQQLQQGGGQ